MVMSTKMLKPIGLDYNSIVFREFTRESLERIERYRQEEAQHVASDESKGQRELEDNHENHRHTKTSIDNEPVNPQRTPNKELAVGQTLSRVLQKKIPPELIGRPIEEIDPFYRTEYVFVVINQNKTIYRFSSTSACFLFSPFNCCRRLAIQALTHPLFSTLVMLTILANCVFMTQKNAPEVTEYIFTIIYTIEALIKCLARGFILEKHTFLRDPWNWLDFIVITLAYVTFLVDLGNVAVLRTFRVLRALKTVAVVPGLITIVNALIRSFIALRDGAVLSTFILSIFALVGLQLYMGVLRQKCVLSYESMSSIFNISYQSYLKEIDNETYWYQENNHYLLCGNASGSTTCPTGYVCWKDRGTNPDFGYTSFDNYGWAMLACFRLMTQDYWENLYLLILSSVGRYHFLYFAIVIFFGSFYLVNLILAIVSMSYFEQRKQVQIENEEREKRKIEDELQLRSEEQQIDGTSNKKSIFDRPFMKYLTSYCCEWTCEMKMFEKCRDLIGFIILDAFADLFITICIILNTLFMALDRYGQSDEMSRALIIGNYVFTTIFTAESMLKIIALSPGKYLKNGWNAFDLLIVTVSLIELGLANVKGLSVLRSFRLLRVFKLAKSWQTLNRLISIIGRSIGALGNLTVILVIIIFIFAVMGMQLFSSKYVEKFGKDIPRWSFCDFFHSFMIVFRVLCGEWIESMWVCLQCAGWPCVPFFLFTFVIGNLVILNLFLALLLASFNSNVLTETEEEEENKIVEAIDRIRRCFRYLIGLCRRQQSKDEEIPLDNPDIITVPEDTETDTTNLPPDCCPDIIAKHFSRCGQCIPKAVQQRWIFIRGKAHSIVEHFYFELIIIISILASSVTLALEDIHTRQQPTFSKVLSIFDKVFTAIFTTELLIKWFAYGIRKYFTNAWNILDFLIVIVGLIGTLLDLFDIVDIPAFKSMRTLRALRPLRALSKFEGIRIVVNALFGAIPSIFNVLLVCLVFWLIFSIMGVQLFAGKFYKCVYAGTHDRVNSWENITTKIDCLSRNFTWENSRLNFDNVLSGYLALFQVATFKGWIEIMADATDAKDVDVQPEYETNIYILLYFVIFIVFGSFFTLNLFIGVVIDNFNQQKRKLSADAVEMFMTEDQKKYYNAMKKMGTKKPTKALPRPRFIIARFFFDLTTNQKFDIFIMTCILLNMICMCLEHYDQNRNFDLALNYVNHIFVAIFTAECVMKLIALNLKYFTISWNVFDFVIVVASILGQTLGEMMANFLVNPTLLRIVRIARIGRILRLVKGAKGIRTLLFALVVSLPALFNIGLLLFLVMFIYSIFGMSFFAHVRKSAGITALFNFETFPNSMIVLFQMCTKAGWSSVYQALSNDRPPDCDPTIKPGSNKGDCGDSAIAAPFLVSYVIITSLVVINMFIAVILENFSRAQEDVEQGLTDDDYDMYYEKWQSVDPSGSQFIRYDQLSDFVGYLEPPLRIPKPNHLILVGMNLPICEGDRIHCVDILDGLTKYFLCTFETSVPVTENDAPMDAKKDRPKDYCPITTTAQRQRELYLGRRGFRAFRNNVERRQNERKNQEITDQC